MSTLKFSVVVLPLFLLYWTTNQLSARHEAKQYDQECSQRNAPTISTSQSDIPCTYTQETAQLHEVDDSRGRTDHEEIYLTNMGGVQKTVTLDREPTWDNWGIKDNRLWSSVVNGPCLVEQWRGKVTTIYKGSLKLTSQDNPDLKYGGGFFPIMAFTFVLFLICCTLLWWKVSKNNFRSA